MSCKHIFLSNLPFGITKEELQDELISIFGEVFKEAKMTNELSIKLFNPSAVTDRSRINQKAVVSGFNSSFGKLLQMSKGKKIRGKFDLNIKWDNGDARDEDGKFVNPLTGTDRRNRKKLFGITHRKMMIAFKTTFLREINTNVFSGKSSTLHFNSEKMESSLLDQAGRLYRCHKVNSKGVMRIEYASEIEALQAVVLLNQNEAFCKSGKFCDYELNNMSHCCNASGLGTNGKILNVEGLVQNFGYIPFDKMSATFLDLSKLNKIHSRCWKCEKKYKLIGIDEGLNFLTAKCECSYDKRLDVMDKDRSFSWNDDTYTKLTLGQASADYGSYETFVVLHNPMQTNYDSGVTYRKTVGPILYEEWKFYSHGYKNKNRCCAWLQGFELIETLLKENSEIFAIELSVMKTQFWSKDNYSKIRRIKLNLDINEHLKKGLTTTSCERKGTVIKIEEDELDPTNIQILVRCKLSYGSHPILNQQITIVPKPNKTEYNRTKQMLNRWINDTSISAFLNFWLDNEETSEIACDKIVRKSLGPKLWPLSRMLKALNAEQTKAFQMAQKFTISVIQGPPGTGKSFTCAILATQFSLEEEGIVLACAPSNYAADGLASGISVESTKFHLHRKVLRIFSKTREDKCLQNLAKDFNLREKTYTYDLLHEEVRKHASWMKDESLNSILKKMTEGKEHLLTQEELKNLDEHVKAIEIEVMNAYDVFVSTVGALSDQRVLTWQKHNENKISTIIVDEAGQLTQPATLSLSLFQPYRTVMVGDHKQLPCNINSYAAETAGLGLSTLEWLEMRVHKVPWTMLKEQHRMESRIRKIVSAVTYNDELKDAENIIQRTADVPLSIYQAIPQLMQNNVLLFDHNNTETEADLSFFNTWETNKTFSIIKNLLQNNVAMSKVTILTLYDAQKKAILSKLKEFGSACNDLTVANVDAYQGRENSIIILNFVRSNSMRKIGFSSSPNRLNVALSRAKFFLIILCDLLTFRGHTNRAWTTFLDQIHKEALIISEEK